MRTAASARREPTPLALRQATGLLALALLLVPGPDARAAEADSLGDLPRMDLRLAVTRAAAGSLLDTSAYRPGGAPVTVPRRPEPRFYDAYLLPRLNSQIQGLRVYGQLPATGRAMDELWLHDLVARSAEAGAVRGATKALRDFFIDLTPVERWASSLPQPSTQTRTSRSGASLGFSLGFSHRMPELGLRYRAGKTVTRLELNPRGTLDFEFTRLGATRSHVTLSCHPANAQYGMSYRLHF